MCYNPPGNIKPLLGLEIVNMTPEYNSANFKNRVYTRSTKRTNSLYIPLPMGEIIPRYLAGESTVELGKAFGVSRDLIRKRLIEFSVPLRGPADANRLMMTNRTPEENARNTEAAHIAARGRKHSIEERSKMAQSREANPSNIGPNEILLFSMLSARGTDVIPQKAVGPYNCDLAAFPVAVEVWGGYFHYFGSHIARTPKRCRYFFDQGWTILIVHMGRTLRAISERGADYIAAYIQQARSDPSFRREYRMIWGTGEFIACGSSDDDKLAIEETLRRSKDMIRNDPLPTW